MASTTEYIRDFGDKTFDEYPFCDADALALCEIFYMPFENIISESFEDEPVDFLSAANKLFASRDFKHSNLGLFITGTPSKKLMMMATAKRFKDIKVLAVKEYYSNIPAVQFAAGTFILPDGTAVIIFRGTDDTISGWREDFDILVRKGTPGYKLVLDYIENASSKFDRIIVSGHSKGGNQALYAGLMCSPETRAKIKYIHNFDGPGFHTYDYFRTGSYDEIKPGYRHYVPTNCLIGMIMAHDYDYKVVKSTKLLGPMQHDVGTWKIKDGEFELAPDTDKLSKVYDVFLAKLAGNCLKEGHSDVVAEVFEKVSVGTNQKFLKGFAQNLGSSLKGAKEAWQGLSPETKEEFKDTFRVSGKFLKESIKCVKNNVVTETTRLCFDFAESLIK